MDWKEVVKDPEERKVFMALDGPNDTWRTIGGIARQTGLSEEQVMKILSKYDMQLTCLSSKPAASGMPLAGLLEKVGS